MAMAFRWGPTENEVMPFEVADCNDDAGCDVFLELANSESWLDGAAKTLMLEFGESSGSGNINLLDILPGPHLEFLYYHQPTTYNEEWGWYPGLKARVRQSFINTGCAFGLGGSSGKPDHPQRFVTHYLTPQTCTDEGCSGECEPAGVPSEWFKRYVQGILDPDDLVWKTFVTLPNSEILFPSAGCWQVHGEFLRQSSA